MKLKNIINRILNPKLTVVQIPDDKSIFADSDITPGKISNAITMLNSYGKLQDINDIYERLMEKDSNLASNIDTRTEALKAKRPMIKTELPDKQKEYFNEVLDSLYPDLVDILIESKLKRFSFRQIRYEIINNLVYPVDLIYYQHLDLRIEKENQVDTLKLYVDDSLKDTTDIRFLKLLRKRAILQPLMKYYVFKSFALNNWASFTEIFGKPIRVGKYSPGATKTEKDELWEMLKNSGTDLSMMISDNVAMEFIDHATKSASSSLYNDLLTFCENTTTKRILGQLLTTNAEKTGSYAQAKVHNMVRNDILSGDARDMIILLDSFLTRLNNLNFSDDHIKTNIDVSPDTNLLERVQIDRVLANDLGIALDDDYFYETYNVPKPGEIQ